MEKYYPSRQFKGVKLIKHFQKLHFLQNSLQVLTRSTIVTLRKLSSISAKMLYHTSIKEKKMQDADQYALLMWHGFRG